MIFYLIFLNDSYFCMYVFTSLDILLEKKIISNILTIIKIEIIKNIR